MTRLPRLVLVLAVCAPAAVPEIADAAKPPAYPSISKVAPLKLGVGDSMTVRGKGFRAGHARTTVVFKRDGGRAIFVKAEKATKTQLTVIIPGKMVNSLTRKSGKPATTRFRVRALTTRFGRRYTSVKGSPLIGPTALTSKASSSDCDGDLVPNSTDKDDDNDLLPDTLEGALKTDPCKRDTDGDGMSDGWEYESALDYNGRAKPSPNKRPYPNALDPSDAAIDSDGDTMTNSQEYAAWATFGANKFPLNYSGGNPATGGKVKPSAANDWMDRDRNGFLSDNERDADGDGLPNQEEDLVDGFPTKLGTTPRDAKQHALGAFSTTHIEEPGVRAIVDVVPLYGVLDHVHKVVALNWLDNDSDGDTVNDGADDSDGDDIGNAQELQNEIASDGPSEELPINACAPNLDARMCIVGDDDIDDDGRPNRVDDDDDGDLLPDTLERSLHLNPYKADTDGDGVDDGYEYLSAKDLNGAAAVPYPSKQSYPNPLDKDDANIDHDGDGLTLAQEFKAWKYTGSPATLSYSDGNQDTSGPGILDADRDVDQDGVSNVAEANGPLSGSAFWAAYTSDEQIKCTDKYVETKYYGPDFQGLNFVDPDSDGDGILDGPDDIDHDGLSNAEEGNYAPGADGFRNPRRSDWCQVYTSVGGRPGYVASNNPAKPVDPYARLQPFNPCKPVNSAACHRFTPFSYYVNTKEYVEDWKGDEPDPNHHFTPPPLAPR